jgi:hypothetical protein
MFADTTIDEIKLGAIPDLLVASGLTMAVRRTRRGFDAYLARAVIRAEQLLRAHTRSFHALADALLEKDALSYRAAICILEDARA